MAIVAAVAGIVQLLWIVLLPMKNDLAWYLHVAQELRQGGRLSVDVVELNPPLIVWLHIPPVWLAGVTGLSERACLFLMVSSFVVAGLTLASFAARHAFGNDRSGRLAFLGMATLAAFGLPGQEFGQREHLIWLALLPYLLVVAGRAHDRAPSQSLAVTVGLVAGLGASLKPHYLLVVVAVELYLGLKGRRWNSWWRIELLGGVATVAGYGAAILLLEPGYLRVARLVSRLYSGFDLWLGELIMHPALMVGVPILLLGLITRDQWHCPVGIRDVLSVSMVAAAGVAMIQAKGWPNHFYPVVAAGLLLLGLMLFDAVRRQPARHANVSAALASAAGPLFIILAWNALTIPAFPSPRLVQAVGREAGGERFAVLSTDLGAGFPLNQMANTQWSLRFAHLWMLPGLYPQASATTSPVEFPYHSAEQRTSTEQYMVDAVIEDLQRNEPVLLVIEDYPGKMGLGISSFDYLEYFSLDPRFREWFRDYQEIDPVGFFRLYKRRAPSASSDEVGVREIGLPPTDPFTRTSLP